jgi:hypothetical protein
VEGGGDAEVLGGAGLVVDWWCGAVRCAAVRVRARDHRVGVRSALLCFALLGPSVVRLCSSLINKCKMHF